MRFMQLVMQFSCAVTFFLLCVKLRSDIKYNSDQASEIMFKSTMTVHISISTRFINRNCVFITLYFLSQYILLLITYTISNYWMRLRMISRIIQTEVNVICRSEAEADNIDRGLNNS